MIDINTGKIIFEEFILEPTLNLNVFLKSDFSNNFRIIIDNKEYKSYNLRDYNIKKFCNDKRYAIYKGAFTFYFKSEKIERVHMNLYTEEDIRKGLSKENELNRKSILDNFLIDMLGTPPYKYRWGEIFSFFDERACSSFIAIKYT